MVREVWLRGQTNVCRESVELSEEQLQQREEQLQQLCLIPEKHEP
jgi:hypothetical protein